MAVLLQAEQQSSSEADQRGKMLEMWNKKNSPKNKTKKPSLPPERMNVTMFHPLVVR